MLVTVLILGTLGLTGCSDDDSCQGQTYDVNLDQDGAVRQVARLSGDTVLADYDAAFAWLARRGVDADRVGVVGFDTGGTVALVVAASRSLGAAVSVSGAGIREPLSPGLPALLEVAPALRPNRP